MESPEVPPERVSRDRKILDRAMMHPPCASAYGDTAASALKASSALPDKAFLISPLLPRPAGL
jgi:hypothetical protein